MASTIIPSQIKRPDGKPISFKMSEGMGHYINSPNNAVWGDLSLILFLTLLSNRWYQLEPTHHFGLGDLGFERLGPVPSHTAHDGGRSVDIYVIHIDGLHRQGGGAKKPINATWVGDGKYDALRTKRLAQLILELNGKFPTVQIINNDPDIHKLSPLILSDAQAGLNPPQHNDHFHIQLQGKHPHSDDHVETLLKISYNW